MTTWIKTTLVAMALVGAAACSKSEDKAAPAPEAAKPAQPTPPAAMPDTPIADQDLPVETDFEDQAAQEITTETYKAELDTLDKEIAAE